MHVSTPLASFVPPASPGAAAPAAQWGVRLALAAFFTLRTVDVCWVAYQSFADATGPAARWLIGGSPLNAWVVATNLVMLVGGSSLLAMVAILARWPFGRMLGLGSGYLTLAWLAMQIVAVGPGASWRLPIAIVSTMASLLVCWMILDREGARAPSRTP